MWPNDAPSLIDTPNALVTPLASPGVSAALSLLVSSDPGSAATPYLGSDIVFGSGSVSGLGSGKTCRNGTAQRDR